MWYHLSMNLKRIWLVLFFLAAAFSPVRPLLAKEPPAKLLVFFSPACHVCAMVKEEVMPEVEKEFGAFVRIEYHDITRAEEYKFLLALNEKYGRGPKVSVPLFYMNGRFLEGQRIKSDYRQFIRDGLNAPEPGKEGLPQIDLFGRFRAFKPAAIVGAGLIDGINPCAFTVIIFFISFLALQGYRKKELTVIGLTFILAVFLTYLLLGVGLFNFFYRLRSFWLVSWAVNIAVGIMAIVLGVLSVFDFIRIKKTGASDGAFLQLPHAVKNRIHSVIGMHYRKTNIEEAQKPHLSRLILSALVTGFLVSLLEAICTGQVYLPTITFILKIAPLKIEAWGYLALYNLMFIAPLFVIFLFALWGATSEDFARFMRKHIGLIKILMAVLFFSLGAFLLWRFNV